MIQTDQQQKYPHYHQAKLTNKNILLVEKKLPFDQSRMIEQA